ncbi:MAG: nucleoside-diphosphate sugar epimerase/dehydratase [Pseudomonadota bacterium]
MTKLGQSASALRSAVAAALTGAPRWVKQLLMLILDAGALIAAAASIPWLLGVPLSELMFIQDHQVFVAIFLPLGLALLWALQFYAMVIRTLDHSAVSRMVLAGIGLSALAMLIYLDRTGLAKAAALGVLTGGMAVGLAGLGRIAARMVLMPRGLGRGQGAPLLIYGAGRAGHQLASALAEDPQFQPVAFIDDDPALSNMRVGALRVHPAKELDALSRRYRTKKIAIAIPSLSRRRRREIMDRLVERAFEVLSIPAFADLMAGNLAVSDLRKVEVDELLGRDVVDLSRSRLHRWFEGRVVMVTGAGGSIGSEVARQLGQLAPARLILFEVSEVALYTIHQELLQSGLADGVEIVPVLGSITDRQRLEAVFAAQAPGGIDAVFHAAAYKHVPLVEANALAGIVNNALGTEALAEAAGRHRVGRFVLVSTDKAVRPTNVMGATKRLAELVVGAAQERHPGTVFSMVRFGNVLGSSGSVIPLFERQIMRGGPVTVTHPEIIRYFMTIPEASQLVITAGLQANGGEVFVLDMGAPVKILDLAKRMIRLSGATVRDAEHPDGDIEIRITGLRPGEKLYEELLIDNSVVATPDPKIFCARETALSDADLAPLLTRLSTAAATGETEAALAVLAEAVQGYRRSTEAGDLSAGQEISAETGGQVIQMPQGRGQ